MNPTSGTFFAMLRHTLAAMGFGENSAPGPAVPPVVPPASAAPTLTPAATREGSMRSLAWCGEIIAANADDVWRMTADHMGAFVASHATLIIIDLPRLRFIDSSGAMLMLRLKKWAQRLHVEVIFAHPPPNVRNVLQLTRLDHLLLEGGQ